MVSDNPETLANDVNPDEGVLWQHALGGDGPAISRVFLWHVNKLGSARKIGLTIQNDSSVDLRVCTVRRQTQLPNVTNYLTIGICLAKALLGDTLDTIAPVDTGLSPGQVGLIEQFDWPDNGFRGAQYEVHVEPVEGAGPIGYTLRTVYGLPATNLRTLVAAPVPKSGPHARGSWSVSEVMVTCPYGVPQNGDAVPTWFSLATGEDNALDFVFKQLHSQIPMAAVNNKGQFGAMYRSIQLTLDNLSPVARQFRVYLNARGGVFAGAVRSSSLEPQVRGIPPLNAPGQVVRLGDGTITAPALGQVTETIELAVAGGAATPVAIIIQPV